MRIGRGRALKEHQKWFEEKSWDQNFHLYLVSPLENDHGNNQGYLDHKFGQCLDQKPVPTVNKTGATSWSGPDIPANWKSPGRSHTKNGYTILPFTVHPSFPNKSKD